MKKYEGLKRILSIASLGGILLTGCSDNSVKTVTIEMNGEKSVIGVNSFSGDGNGNFYVGLDGSLDYLFTSSTEEDVNIFPPVPATPALETTTTVETVLTNPTLSTTVGTTEVTTETTEVTTEATTEVTTVTTMDEVMTNPTLFTTVTTTTEEVLTNPSLPQSSSDEVKSTALVEDYYNCEYGYTDYVVNYGDTLYKIASSHDMPYQSLMDVNGLSDSNIKEGQHLSIPTTFVYYNCKLERHYSDVALMTNVDIDTICELNNVTADSNITNKKVLVQKLYGNKSFYKLQDGNNGYVVGNNVIIGKKLVYGYGETNNKFLSLYEMDYGYEKIKRALLYSFENGKLTYTVLLDDAKDIDCIDGVLVVYVYLDKEYDSVYVDSNNDRLITYDGKQHNFDSYSNGKTYSY